MSTIEYRMDATHPSPIVRGFAFTDYFDVGDASDHEIDDFIRAGQLGTGGPTARGLHAAGFRGITVSWDRVTAP